MVKLKRARSLSIPAVKEGSLIVQKPRATIDPEMRKKPVGTPYSGRANIRARNPLALAKQKLLSLNQSCSFTGTNLRVLLERAFGYLGLEYEQMFDPINGSPVYYGLYRETAALAASSSDLRYGRFLRKIKEDQTQGPGEIPPDCADLVISENQAVTIGGSPLQYRDTSANLPNNGLEFNDPVQGCVADCWFISALSSVALAETTANPAIKKIARTLPVYVCPPPNPSWATKKSISTSMAFYTNQEGTRPFYGHLNPNKLRPEFYESWVSFYEKCFASYYQQNRTPTNGAFLTIDKPIYSSLNYKDAFGALADITGRIVTTELAGATKDYFGVNGAPDNDAGIIEKIRKNACGAPLDPNGVFLPVKKPAVAHTYFSVTEVPALAQRPQYGAAVAYNCAGLPANHAFSILGLYQKNDIKYVILRNPWGHSGNTGSFSGELQGSLATSLNSLVWTTKINIANPGIEGIFGLSSITFMRYFAEFGCTDAI
jgi:hypothetical protein